MPADDTSEDEDEPEDVAEGSVVDGPDAGASGEDEAVEVETGGAREELQRGRERLEREADRAIEQLDEGLVDLLSWVLDTETRARIYVHLRQQPGSTSDEVAEGTGLYPSTVREALAELHEEGIVERGKRASGGAGNNPYEYTAIAPSDLVTRMVEQVQEQLNTVFNLDRYLSRGSGSAEDSEPVTITVEDEDEETDG